VIVTVTLNAAIRALPHAGDPFDGCLGVFS
jgi:hypothetical protein